MNPPNELDLDLTQAALSGEPAEAGGRCVRCGSRTKKPRLLCSKVCRTAARMEPVTVKIDGVIDRPIAIAADRGISKQTLYRRIKLGWSLKDAVTKPPRKKRPPRRKKAS